ncbi:MAG: D-alanyl-D-alanine endopeptidase [Rhodoferax sp.]|nr:D-alanyl-D-alanine endopeptidase [Rhodoferax sp.]
MRSPFFHSLFRLQGLLLVSVILVSLCGTPVFAAVNQEIKREVAQQQTVKKQTTKQLKEARQRQSKKPIASARPTKKLASKSVAKQKMVRAVARQRVTQRRVVAKSRVNLRVEATLVAKTKKSNLAGSHRPDPQALKTALVSGAASSVVRATDKLQVSAASTAANDDPLSLRSGSALVVDEGTGRILLSKNADTARPIASLTKLMTAAVILDAHQPMDQVIEITDADIDTLKWSASRLRPGTKLTREELLRLALMSSENRAAHALARNYPGGLAAFIPAMNAKARALGMNATRYVEPTGLSPQNESTAHDLALLVKAAYHYPLIRDFSTHPESEVDIGPRTLQFRNTDHLVFNRGWDILLQKTGYINEAGHCLVLQTKFEGRRVIVVLLDAWGKYSHFGDAQRIRTWLEARGFDALHDPASSVSEASVHPSVESGFVRTALVEKAPAAVGE